jgi:hypothetical protein
MTEIRRSGGATTGSCGNAPFTVVIELAATATAVAARVPPALAVTFTTKERDPLVPPATLPNDQVTFVPSKVPEFVAEENVVPGGTTAVMVALFAARPPRFS